MIIKMHDGDLVVAEDISVVVPFPDELNIEVHMRNGGNDNCFTYEFKNEDEFEDCLQQLTDILTELHSMKVIQPRHEPLKKAVANVSVRNIDSVDVFVKDAETNEPIPNIQISVYDCEDNYVDAGKTDSNGLLNMSCFADGEYTVCFDKPKNYKSIGNRNFTIKRSQSNDSHQTWYDRLIKT